MREHPNVVALRPGPEADPRRQSISEGIRTGATGIFSRKNDATLESYLTALKDPGAPENEWKLKSLACALIMGRAARDVVPRKPGRRKRL